MAGESWWRHALQNSGCGSDWSRLTVNVGLVHRNKFLFCAHAAVHRTKRNCTFSHCVDTREVGGVGESSKDVRTPSFPTVKLCLNVLARVQANHTVSLGRIKAPTYNTHLKLAGGVSL